MSMLAELGPVLPPRGEVYRMAHEVRRLADLACHCAADGPHCDLARAVKKLEEMRAVLGPSPKGDER